jgi:hypothetical protein
VLTAADFPEADLSRFAAVSVCRVCRMSRILAGPKGDLAVFFQINFRIEGFYDPNRSG